MDELNIWCGNNRLEVNISKSKIIHFRNQSKPKSTVEFRCGHKTIETVSQYIYISWFAFNRTVRLRENGKTGRKLGKQGAGPSRYKIENGRRITLFDIYKVIQQYSI